MRTQFITDDHGKKLSVILPIKEYQKMIEELEELDDIKLYDDAKAPKSEPVPIKEAFQLLDAKRKKKA